MTREHVFAIWGRYFAVLFFFACLLAPGAAYVYLQHQWHHTGVECKAVSVKPRCLGESEERF